MWDINLRLPGYTKCNKCGRYNIPSYKDTCWAYSWLVRGSTESNWVPCIRTENGTSTIEEELLCMKIFMGKLKFEDAPLYIQKLVTNK